MAATGASFAAAFFAVVLLAVPAASATGQFDVFNKLMEKVTIPTGDLKLNLGSIKVDIDGNAGDLAIQNFVLSPHPDPHDTTANTITGVAAFTAGYNGKLVFDGDYTLDISVGLDVDFEMEVGQPKLFEKEPKASFKRCKAKCSLPHLSLEGPWLKKEVLKLALEAFVDGILPLILCGLDGYDSIMLGVISSLMNDTKALVESAVTKTGVVDVPPVLYRQEAALEAMLGKRAYADDFAVFNGSRVLRDLNDVLVAVFDTEVLLPSPHRTGLPSISRLGVEVEDRSVWRRPESGEPYYPGQPQDFPATVVIKPEAPKADNAPSQLLSGLGSSIPLRVQNVTLHGLEIRGLNSVHGLELREADAAALHALYLQVGMRTLGLTLNVSVSLENEVTKYRTEQWLEVEVADMVDLSLNATLALLFDTHEAGRYDVGDFTDVLFGDAAGGAAAAAAAGDALRCLFYPIRYVNASTLFASLGGLGSVSISEVRPGAAKAPFTVVNDLLQQFNYYLLTPLVFPALPAVSYDFLAVIDGLAGTLLHKLVNQTGPSPCNAAADADAATPPVLLGAAAAAAPTAVAPAIDYVDWNNASSAGARLLGLGSWFVGQFLGVDNASSSVMSAEKPTVNNVTSVLFFGAPANAEEQAQQEEQRLALNVSYTFAVGPFSGRVDEVSIGGLNALSHLEALRPVNGSAYTIENELGAANLSVSADVFLACHDGVNPPFALNVTLSLSLPHFYVNASLFAKVKERRAAELRLTNYTDTGCVLSLFHEENGLYLPVISGQVGYGSVLSVDTPGELMAVGLDVQPGTHGLPRLHELVAHLARPAARLQLTQALNRDILSEEDGQLGKIANRQATKDLINNEVQEKGQVCQTGPDPTPVVPRAPPAGSSGLKLTQERVYFMIYGIVVCCAIVLTSLVMYGRHKRAAMEAEERTPLMGGKKELQKRKTPSREPLFYHETTPDSARYLMPALIGLTICVFLTGNITLGASVQALVHLAGGDVTFNNVYTYNLASTVTDTWNGNAQALAAIVSLTSGVWPYLKLFLLLFTWFADDCVLPAERRGTVLRTIDFLGKWSLVDDFLQVMMMVAFEFYMTVPASWLFMPTDDFFQAQLNVRPAWGVYAFVTAAICTLILNHFQIAVHRTALEHDARAKEHGSAASTPREDGEVGPASEEKRRLRAEERASARHSKAQAESWFTMGAADDTRRVLCLYHSVEEEAEADKAPAPLPPATDMPGINIGMEHVTRDDRFLDVFRWKNMKADKGKGVVVFLLLGLSVCMLVAGCIVESFYFQFEGLSGVVLKFVESDSLANSYSVFTLAKSIMRQAPSGAAAYMGYVYLASTFLLFAVLMPMASNVCLAVLWACPLKSKTQKRLYVLNEILAAWSSLEVFVLALIIALTELPRFAEFMGASMCGKIGVQSLLDVAAAPLALPDTECFKVKCVLLKGCWILFGSALLSNMIFFITTRTAHTMLTNVDHHVGKTLTPRSPRSLENSRVSRLSSSSSSA